MVPTWCFTLWNPVVPTQCFTQWHPMVPPMVLGSEWFERWEVNNITQIIFLLGVPPWVGYRCWHTHSLGIATLCSVVDQSFVNEPHLTRLLLHKKSQHHPTLFCCCSLVCVICTLGVNNITQIFFAGYATLGWSLLTHSLTEHCHLVQCACFTQWHPGVPTQYFTWWHSGVPTRVTHKFVCRHTTVIAVLVWIWPGGNMNFNLILHVE